MKTKHHKVWFNLQLKYAAGHLEWQPLLKITKMLLMALLLKIETCNEKKTPLSLGLSSIRTGCQTWMEAITKNYKNGCQGIQQHDS